ncbi:MAG TPA: ADP-glyceromanno-heptose 6-epimerase [Acidobacteriaceae bacterium]|nr:ADP-glyceromanno-heptose 6-epimerase [Acidobacteriaceae bacterium]
MIVVTGGAGFIGSNLIHELNRAGENEIFCVDNLRNNSSKFLNLEGAAFSDYMDKAEFRRAIASRALSARRIRAILHQGACSNTLEDDGAYMMDNNFTYSKELLHFALQNRIPFVYASTAAVYGLSQRFRPEPENERPLNVYGFSKLVFDNYIRRLLPTIESTVVGLRYFNVYGRREQHKGRMSSVMHHFSAQLKDSGVIRMFRGSGGYGDGEQRRDFVYVRDICRMNLFFAGLGVEKERAGMGRLQETYQGIFNAGTANSRSFNDVAQALIQLNGPRTDNAAIEYIPFPADLAGRYQHFTQADLTMLQQQGGYTRAFTTLEDGMAETFAAA